MWGTAAAIAVRYDASIEASLAAIEHLLKGEYQLSKRSLALFLLQGDSELETEVRKKDGPNYPTITGIVSEARTAHSQPLRQIIALRRQEEAGRIVSAATSMAAGRSGGFASGLSRAMMSPITGVPILLIVLYFGLYQFVGVLGAQTAVGFLEGTVFGKWINPRVTDFVTGAIPLKALQDLFVGDYGIVTLAITYAVALILPIVTFFFIVFSLIEDSGYLPRLAMLIDRLFKKIGLSGRAVIPMVLGFGCDTMATIVTRTQETKRERVITTLLLALAIPCSAQLGVIFAILSGSAGAMLVWTLTVGLVLVVVGYLASKVIPGDRASFYMEIPPLRLPKLSNVFVKTYSRLRWYFTEVLPIFILASVLIWLGQLVGLFDVIVGAIEPLVRAIGLPTESASAFLFGFFRRDYGAAGLYDLYTSGILIGIPLVVSAVTLTLFIPCIAQFSVMAKERGLKTALAITAFIFPFAFGTGFVLSKVLNALGVSI